MKREPLNTSGSVLIIPDWEVAREEKKIFILGLHPESWFQNRERKIFTFEIKTPDEKAWNNWDTFHQEIIAPIEMMVLLLFFVEMYKLGIRDDNEIYKKWEEFAHAPDWVEFFNDVVMHRTNKEWWENVKPKFEELKVKKWDDLKARGKFIGKINFVQTIEAKSVEETNKILEEIAHVNGYGYPMKLYGRDCVNFVMEMFEKQVNKLAENPITISV